MRFGQYTEGPYTYWYERVGPILYLVQHDRISGENSYIVIKEEPVTVIELKKTK